jgi:hypothetical protein
MTGSTSGFWSVSRSGALAVSDPSSSPVDALRLDRCVGESLVHSRRRASGGLICTSATKASGSCEYADHRTGRDLELPRATPVPRRPSRSSDNPRRERGRAYAASVGRGHRAPAAACEPTSCRRRWASPPPTGWTKDARKSASLARLDRRGSPTFRPAQGRDAGAGTDTERGLA